MKYLIDYAMSFLGTPYKWGGQSAIKGEGVDCSGFVQIVLESVGMDPKNDQTAHGLYKYFSAKGHTIKNAKQGALAFYGKPTRITHIALCIDGYRVIEAGGGRSSTTDYEAAVRANAAVRIRPVRYRRDLVALVMPKYKNVTKRVS